MQNKLLKCLKIFKKSLLIYVPQAIVLFIRKYKSQTAPRKLYSEGPDLLRKTLMTLLDTLLSENQVNSLYLDNFKPEKILRDIENQAIICRTYRDRLFCHDSGAIEVDAD